MKKTSPFARTYASSRSTARQTTLGFILSSFICALFIASGCTQSPYYKESRMMMGTIVEITCQDKSAINAGFEEIKRIEKIADNFDPASEISRLNQDGHIKASNELMEMVRESLKYNFLSAGAFDITINPVVALWKERIKKSQDEKAEVSLPSQDEIKDRLRLTGSDKISINENESSIVFSQPAMSIDLGAIAKGYAVDKAIARLKERGINSAMVNAGGNIYCLGKKGKRKWRVGIQHPRKPQNLLFTLELENQAVATSGDYQQYFIAGGRRYSHIIDPKTGYPVDNKVISATITAPTAAQADGLSTSVFVLGKIMGLELVKKIGNVEARIIEEGDQNVSRN
jgi:thiamine biosynthesis lipoprotein ApbE